jgi:hypothetical protein
MRVDLVEVSPAHPMPGEIAALDQVGHDPMSGPLGDSDVRGDVAQPHPGGAHDAEERERVIAEERPGGRHGLMVQRVDQRKSRQT